MTILLKGNWNEGYAIGVHTIKSIPIGENEFGHMQFDTTRSEIGELVYQLKYDSNTGVIPEIVAKMQGITFSEAIDCIIPVPPSKYRKIQPVIVLANEYGSAAGLEVIEAAITKKATKELKGVDDPGEREEILRNSHGLSQGVDLNGRNILLIDDVYRSGATLRAATDILLGSGARGVFVMTMTKTRTNR